MGSRLFDEIREQRGLCYSVYAGRPRLRRRAGAAARRRASSRASASRPTRACARSSPSCAADGPTEEEVERARAYAAGRRVLAFENTNAVARYAANQAIVYGEDIDPDAGDRAARRGHLRRGRATARAGRPRRARRRVRGPAHRVGLPVAAKSPPAPDAAAVAA